MGPTEVPAEGWGLEDQSLHTPGGTTWVMAPGCCPRGPWTSCTPPEKHTQATSDLMEAPPAPVSKTSKYHTPLHWLLGQNQHSQARLCLKLHHPLAQWALLHLSWPLHFPSCSMLMIVRRTLALKITSVSLALPLPGHLGLAFIHATPSSRIPAGPLQASPSPPLAPNSLLMMIMIPTNTYMPIRGHSCSQRETCSFSSFHMLCSGLPLCPSFLGRFLL